MGAKAGVPRAVSLAFLGLGCSFSPTYAAYAACDAGQCAAGSRCLVSQNICVPLCGETAQCEPSILTNSLPPATMCVGYTEGLAAAGGTPPYAWSIGGGSLPAGLTLDTSGVISGTPIEPGAFAPDFEVTDVGAPPQSALATLALNVGSGALTVSTPSQLPGVRVGQPYNQKLTVTGGNPPHTWTVCSGTLPSWLSLSAVGDLTGTPTDPETDAFVVEVTDSALATGAKALSLTVTQ
jgi:large repetitive protein